MTHYAKTITPVVDRKTITPRKNAKTITPQGTYSMEDECQISPCWSTSTNSVVITIVTLKFFRKDLDDVIVSISHGLLFQDNSKPHIFW